MRSFLLHKETKTCEGSFLAECVGGNEVSGGAFTGVFMRAK